MHLQVAMQDAMLHYIRNSFCLTTKTGKAGAARRSEDARSAPIRPATSTPARRADRTITFTSIRAAAIREHWPRLLEGDRARRPDRRSALRDARSAGRERGGNRPDHHRVHEQARQVRVHARDRRRRSLRGRARYAGDPERSQLRGAGDHPEDRAPAPRRRSRWRAGPCASTASAGRGETGAAARAAQRRSAQGLARHDRRSRSPRCATTRSSIKEDDDGGSNRF